jgi:hypothetical protein
VLSQSTDTERELLVLREAKDSLVITLELRHEFCVDYVANGHSGICIFEVMLVLQV